MLYKILIFVLLVASADALKANPISRRAMLGNVAAGAAVLAPMDAYAKELKQASDAEVYARASDAALNTDRVIQRAKDNKLVVGEGATCNELEAIIAVDKQAIRFEVDKLEALDENAPDYKKQRATVEEIQAKIEKQVKRLNAIREDKQCGADDADIYKRADEGKLNSARVIERAESGKLVSGAGTTCAQLDAIISIDKDALQVEKEKLKELQNSNDPRAKTQIKIVTEAEDAIGKQITRLKRLKTFGC